MLVIGLECHCVWCKEAKRMRNDIYGNTDVRNRLRQVDRDFMAKMIRIGRNSGVPNKRMREPKMTAAKLLNLIDDMLGGSFNGK